MRRFEVAKGFENVSINMPKRATTKSAGYDICAIEDTIINPGEIVLVKTGLKALMEDDEVLMLYPRSSLSLKKYLTIPNNVGIIDADYYGNINNDGHIFVAIYNFSSEKKIINKNERIAQGIFLKYLKIDDDSSLNVRVGGFGSTK